MREEEANKKGNSLPAPLPTHGVRIRGKHVTLPRTHEDHSKPRERGTMKP